MTTLHSEADLQAHLAFYAALGSIEPVAKSKIADTGKYSYGYADLGDILDECKRACELHRLAITQWPSAVDGLMALNTRLIHESGGTVMFDPLMMKLPNEAQAFGSALTYARRYALMAIFGIATEDDDGAAATKAERAPQQHGGYRSGAEERIHGEFTKLAQDGEDEVGKAVRAQFREVFNTGLSELPVARHGDALEWVLAAIPIERARLTKLEAAQEAES